MTDTTCRRPIHWEYGVRTDVGAVRQVNEDSVLAKPDVGLWAVADGMGGHKVGDVASQKVVQALGTVSSALSLGALVDEVEDVLLQANTDMLTYAQNEFGDATMGSTVLALIIRGGVGVCLWAGDSRLYRLRNNTLSQLTRDHSQVEEMVSMGLLTTEQAESHPQRNVITRAVGVEPQLFLETTAFEVRIGDTFLLCSDGLYDALSQEAISTLLSVRDVVQSTDSLIERSVAMGARDNVSVVVLQGQPGKLNSNQGQRVQ